MKITTRGSILEAFTQLLEEEPYNRVTVKDISQRCGICRNTFYYHFRDIEDLFESSVQEWADRIDLEHTVLLLPLDCLRLLVDEGLRRKKLIYYIMRSNYRDLFFETIKKFITAAVNRYIDQYRETVTLSESDRKLLVRFYRSVFVGLLIDWFESGMEYDLMDFAVQACRLVFNAEWKNVKELASRLPQK